MDFKLNQDVVTVLSHLREHWLELWPVNLLKLLF